MLANPDFTTRTPIGSHYSRPPQARRDVVHDLSLRGCPDRREGSLKRAVIVTDDIACFVGAGACDDRRFPPDTLLVEFGDAACRLREGADGSAPDELRGHIVTIAVSRGACLRLFDAGPRAAASWFLPAELRGHARAVGATGGDSELGDLLLASRCIELLHGFFGALGGGRLVEIAGETQLREQEIACVTEAHRIISEDWRRPLTVREIARRAGMSRTKLARCYRDMYRCTIGEAVIARRLTAAQQLLVQSDLHVSTVGYRCGYTNNTSFTRAFTRHFGVTPSVMRQGGQGTASSCARVGACR